MLSQILVDVHVVQKEYDESKMGNAFVVKDKRLSFYSVDPTQFYAKRMGILKNEITSDTSYWNPYAHFHNIGFYQVIDYNIDWSDTFWVRNTNSV